MRQSLFWVLAPLGIFCAILIIAPSFLAVISIGDRLAAISAWLELLFYATVVGALYAFALRPVALALYTPELHLGNLENAPYGAKMQVARRVLRNPRLSKPLKDELGYAVIRAGILDELLKRSIEHLDQSAQTIIDEKARVIFLSNTIMQNGRLEAITLLMVNLQMVQELIEHYGHRTSVKALWTIYSEIFITAMLVDKMDEMDLDSTLEIILSNTITELPGFTNVVHSLIEGTTSALFTLRVGAITRNLLCNGMHDASPRHERRVSANQQAFRRAAAILPGATAELTKTLIQKAGSIIGRNVFGSRKPNPSDPAPSA